MSEDAKVRCINDALFQLGQEPVTDLGDSSLQGSVAAVKLLRVADQARETVLARHGWVDALGYVTLPPATIANYVNWRYPTAFLTPGDCLHVWEIEGEPRCADLAGGWGPRWQVGQVVVGSSTRQIIRAAATKWAGPGPLTQLNIAYVRKLPWSGLRAHLRDAVAYELAARGAYSVTSDKALAAGLAKTAEAKVQLAISVEGTQEGGQPPVAPSIPAAIRNFSR